MSFWAPVIQSRMSNACLFSRYSLWWRYQWMLHEPLPKWWNLWEFSWELHLPLPTCRQRRDLLRWLELYRSSPWLYWSAMPKQWNMYPTFKKWPTRIQLHMFSWLYWNTLWNHNDVFISRKQFPFVEESPDP